MLTSNLTDKSRHPLTAMNDNMTTARYPPPVIPNGVVDVVHVKDAKLKATMRYGVTYFCDVTGSVELYDKFAIIIRKIFILHADRSYESCNHKLSHN